MSHRKRHAEVEHQDGSGGKVRGAMAVEMCHDQALASHEAAV